MGGAIIRRIMQTLGVLLLVSLLVFFGIYAIGNPVEMFVPGDADQAERLRVTIALGLDKPVWEQYLIFLQRAVQGDLGLSFVHARPALELIFERLPATLELVGVALLIAVLIGMPLGIYAGLKPESWVSRTIMAGSVMGYSLPTFWLGLVLIMLFSVQLGWLPASGRGDVGTALGPSSSLFTSMDCGTCCYPPRRSRCSSCRWSSAWPGPARASRPGPSMRGSRAPRAYRSTGSSLSTCSRTSPSPS